MLNFFSVCIVFLYCAVTILSDGYAADSIEETSTEKRDYPAHWQFYFKEEPIFDGKIRIVETGTQHKQTIILVHGLGNNGLNDWLGTISSLEDQFHVISFDLPGFGQSDAGEGLYSPSNYSHLLHWLTVHFAKGKVIVIGHSLGGAISLRYAHDYQDEVDKLILVDAAGILERTVFTKHLARFTASSHSQPSMVDGWLQGITRRIDSVSERILSATDSLPDISRLILYDDAAREYLFKDRQIANAAMALIAEDFSQAISEIRVPTQIIWGEKDSVAPLRTGKLLAGRINDASLTVLPGVGHVPMKEYPRMFNNILRMNLLFNETGESIYAPKAQAVNKDYNCDSENDKTITGVYRYIRINNCQHIRLNNVFTQSLTIRNARVNLDNVKVVSKEGTALLAENAVIEGTLVYLEGNVSLKAVASRVDLAGSSLITPSNQAMELSLSKVYFSVSDVTENAIKRYVHKIVEAN